MYNSRVKQSPDLPHEPVRNMDPAGPPEKCYIEPIPCKNSEIYNALNSLICEYLEVNGLEQALQSFTTECKQKKLPCPNIALAGPREVKAAFTHYDGEALLKSFDEGRLDSFLKLWKQFQTHIQVTSEDMKKLEVYLRVHFAIYPRAKDYSAFKQTQAMQQLKTFFEENSATLSSDATILPLFALPFVSDPRPHPIFKDLFHETWTSKLRTQLETTVNKYFELLQENITMHCKLASVVVTNANSRNASLTSSGRFRVRKGNSRSTGTVTSPVPTALSPGSIAGSSGDSISFVLEPDIETVAKYHHERFFRLLSINRKSRRALSNARDNYSKLLKVTSILVEALEKCYESDEPQLELILQQCIYFFPEIFTDPGNNPSSTTSVASNKNTTPFKSGLDHFKKFAAAASTTSFTSDPSELSLFFLGIPDINIERLDYHKIKTDLSSDKITSTDKLCLLQALRWLITKTSGAMRSGVISHFVKHDLLGLNSQLKSNTGLRQILFSSLLSPTPTYQKESISRWVNAFASTWAGRSYLSSTNYIIETLIQSLKTFKTQEESFICHMVIATLQKLSLRKSMRRIMIDHNVIPWVVKYIKSELHRDIIRDELLEVKGKEQDSKNSATQSNLGDVIYGDSPFNNYLMEYAWALLMNLCLHPESTKSALTVDFEFLHCITTMLTTRRSSIEYTPYILSTLFSLLRSPVLFQKAKGMNLDKTLGPFIPHHPPEIQSHIKHLLTQLYEKDNVDRLTASGETDYDDTDNPDPDDVEPELELQESWMNTINENTLTGDDLLIKDYMLPNDVSLGKKSLEIGEGQTVQEVDSKEVKKLNPAKEVVQASDATYKQSGPFTKESGILLRPTTPTRIKSAKVIRSVLSIKCLPLPINNSLIYSNTSSSTSAHAHHKGKGAGPKASSTSVVTKTSLIHPSSQVAPQNSIVLRNAKLSTSVTFVTNSNTNASTREKSKSPAPQEFIIGLPPLPFAETEICEQGAFRLKEAVPVISINPNKTSILATSNSNNKNNMMSEHLIQFRDN